MKKILSAILISAIFSGCASFSEGTITYDADGTPHWEKLKSSGISRDAFRNPITGRLEPQGETDTFYSESPRVTWWGSFAPLSFLTAPVFSVRWIDPSGNIFWEEDFAPNNTDFQLYKISLPIATSPAKNYPGWWQVEIYLKEKLVDRKKFQIIAEPPARGVPITQ